MKKLKIAFFITILTGLIAAALTLVSPSETSSAVWMGLSKSRLIVFFLQIGLTLAGCVFFAYGLRTRFQSPFFTRILEFLNQPAYFITIRNSLLALSVFASFSFFYFSVFVPQALSAFTGWITLLCWMAFFLYKSSFNAPLNYHSKFKFPRWNNLSAQQQKTVWILILIGVVYFCVFIPVNLLESESLYTLDVDESIKYPIVINMLTSKGNLHDFLYHFLAYTSYIYGFQYYFWSALILLPVKLAHPADFADQLQLNMLLLRQLINVLPSILSGLLITYLATHFKKRWGSILLFTVIMTLPAIIRVNNTFWHPDSIHLLYIALVLFFLERDNLEFGANFYLAAAACGISIALRLFGVFYFLAILVLLVLGWMQKRLTLKQAVIKGGAFCLIMIAVILISNPYIYCPGELSAAINIFKQQNVNISEGMAGVDPMVYQTGLRAWWPIFIENYGAGFILALLVVSCTVGVIGKGRRIFYISLTAWLLVVGVYLIWFVSAKSYWYLQPFLMMLYCSALAIPSNMDQLIPLKVNSSRRALLLKRSIHILLIGIGIYQLILNLQWIINQGVFRF